MNFFHVLKASIAKSFMVRAFVLLGLMGLVSCGDLFMKKDQNEETMIDQFSQCELDTQALSEIFAKDIEIELLCLERNLKLFIDVVKSDQPGYLSLKELKLYIEKHVSDIEPQVVESLDVVFETNSLLFGDHKEYIARDNVAKLIELLIEVNKVMVENKVVDLFQSNKELSLSEHNNKKSRIFAAFSYIATKLEKVIITKNNFSTLNIDKALRVFRTEGNAEVLDKALGVLFLKKILLGGDNEVLTAQEFQTFIQMLPDSGKIAYDIVQLSNITLKEDEEETAILTLKDDFESVVRSLSKRDKLDQTVMNLTDIIGAINLFAPEAKRFTQYEQEILKLKEILLETSSPKFTLNEVIILLDKIVLENLKRSAFFYRTFELNREILTSGKLIDKDLTDFALMDEGEKKFKDDFNQVIKSYRFFRGKDLIATYSKSVDRSPLKLIEVAIIEDFVKRFFRYYGEKDGRSNGGLKVSFQQLVNFLKDFLPVFEGEKFIEPNRVEASAETIFLMTSLFQSHSDGDLDLEVNETVQFLITVLSGFEVQNVISEAVEKTCPLDDERRYSPDCFRDNFLQLMQTETDRKTLMSDHFPKMYEFLASLSPEKQREFIVGAETISRSCMTYNDKEIPMTSGDIFLVFSGLSSIEQTMIRLDLNQNNNLEPNELDLAFKIYEDSIKALIPGRRMKRFAKSFFLYLVKYKRVPKVTGVSRWRKTKEGLHFLKFLMSRRKYSPADRQTLLSIMQTLQSYSESEPYPCHLLLK